MPHHYIAASLTNGSAVLQTGQPQSHSRNSEGYAAAFHDFLIPPHSNFRFSTHSPVLRVRLHPWRSLLPSLRLASPTVHCMFSVLIQTTSEAIFSCPHTYPSMTQRPGGSDLCSYWFSIIDLAAPFLLSPSFLTELEKKNDQTVWSEMITGFP